MPAHVAYAKPMQGIAPVVSAIPTGSELVADAATGSQQAQKDDVAVVTATSDVYVAFGASPAVPSATNGHRIASGQTREFGNLQAGWVMRVAAA